MCFVAQFKILDNADDMSRFVRRFLFMFEKTIINAPFSPPPPPTHTHTHARRHAREGVGGEGRGGENEKSEGVPDMERAG